jgi:hypothetical protein
VWFKHLFVSLKLFSQVRRRAEKLSGMVQNLEHEASAHILAFTWTCNIFRIYGWVCQISCFEMIFGCVLMLTFVVSDIDCVVF